MTDPTTKTVVLTDDAPAPAHTFSQGVRKGGLLQVSGQGAVDPATASTSARATCARRPDAPWRTCGRFWRPVEPVSRTS